MKRIYVIHDDAEDMGLRAPEFATRTEAEAKRDEWNKEFPGHRVLEIEEDDTANNSKERRQEENVNDHIGARHENMGNTTGNQRGECRAGVRIGDRTVEGGADAERAGADMFAVAAATPGQQASPGAGK